MKYLIQCIIIIFQIIYLTKPQTISKEICTLESFSKFITECDKKRNKRLLIYYKKKECVIPEEKVPYELLFFSKLPTIEIECEINCPPGHKIDYNPLKKEVFCSECPLNTYSLGSNFNIEKWSNEILSLFTINCYSIYGNEKRKNYHCSKFTISQDRNFIISGYSSDVESTGYEIELIYSFNAKNNGSFVFSYDKNTIFNRIGSLNGNLKIYFDYNLKNDDYDLNSKLKYSSIQFNEGNHQIALIYNYRKDLSNNNLNLKIGSFSIYNIKEDNFECKPCYKPNWEKGATYCSGCKLNEIYSKGECIKCPKYKLNFNNKCVNIEKCSQFDINIISLSNKCESSYFFWYKRKVNYEMNYPILCYGNNYVENIDYSPGQNFAFELYYECESFNRKNIKISEKKKDEYLLNNFKLVNNFYSMDEIFDEYNWKSNGKFIYIPKNPKIGKNYILIKNFEIISFRGYVKIGFELNMLIQETLTFSLNGDKQLITFNGVHTEKLQKGKYTLTLEFKKKSEDLNDINIYKRIPVKIFFFQIVGSQFNYNTILSEKCPKDYLRSEDGFNCIKTDNIEIKPKEKKIDNCPIFTTENNSICYLNEILEIREEHLKFNLFPFIDYIKNYSDYQNNYNEIKSELNILGPLKINESDFEINIYFSIFFPQKFKYKKQESFSHIIGIQNNKILSLGKKIDSIKLENFRQETGILIHYSEGEKCSSNPNKNYNTYLLLSCDKTINGFSFPKIISFDNDKCSIYFEINSPLFCKICVSSQLSYSNGKCKKGIKAKIYHEQQNCIIDYVNNEDKINYTYIPIDNDNLNDILLYNNSDILNVYLDRKYNRNEDYVNNKNDYGYVIAEYELSSHYLTNRLEYDECTFYDKIENNYRLFLLFIALCYILLFCIYKFLCVSVQNSY
jgi:hypothetical protein